MSVLNASAFAAILWCDKGNVVSGRCETINVFGVQRICCQSLYESKPIRTQKKFSNFKSEKKFWKRNFFCATVYGDRDGDPLMNSLVWTVNSLREIGQKFFLEKKCAEFRWWNEKKDYFLLSNVKSAFEHSFGAVHQCYRHLFVKCNEKKKEKIDKK